MSLFSVIIRRRKHRRPYLFGLIAAVIILSIFFHPDTSSLHAHGPMNIGHEKLKCEYCHQSANGTFRQQLQANTQYLIGLRTLPVEIGFKTVTGKTCLRCHARPTDNHPIYRFTEPKYSKARRAIRPHNCISCHREHTASRVTIERQFCKHCHAKLALKKDPLAETHQTLVKKKQWDTCLGCHDFHGNHKMKTKTELKQAHSTNTLDRYFAGDKSPYSKHKKYKAKEKI